MSVCIRFIKHFDLFKRFNGYLNVCKKQDVDILVNAILNFLKYCKLDQVLIDGQSHDGYNVVSDVQVKTKIYHPYAT